MNSIKKLKKLDEQVFDREETYEYLFDRFYWKPRNLTALPQGLLGDLFYCVGTGGIGGIAPLLL